MRVRHITAVLITAMISGIGNVDAQSQKPNPRLASITPQPLKLDPRFAAIKPQSLSVNSYIDDVQMKLMKSWTPPQGPTNKRAVLEFEIHKKGDFSSLRLAHPSGVALYDEAAQTAVEKSAPFNPTPLGDDGVVEVQVSFDYTTGEVQVRGFDGTAIGQPSQQAAIGQPSQQAVINQPLQRIVISEPLEQIAANQPPQQAAINQPLLRAAIGDGDKRTDAPSNLTQYIDDLNRRVKQAWLPPNGQEAKQVTLTFNIANSGEVSNVQITSPADADGANEAAILAVKNSSPMRPIPAGCGPNIQIEFAFNYNEFNGEGMGRVVREF